MNTEEAKRIIDAMLAVPAERPGTDLASLWSPPVFEALAVASQCLAANVERNSEHVERPRNAGAPWEVEEDERLRLEFLEGRSLIQLAEAHGRTNGAIKSRLMRLGLLVLDNPILPAIEVPEAARHEDASSNRTASDPAAPLLAQKGYALGVKSTEVFRPEEIVVLKRYGFWLEALATGRIAPTTSAQEQFVRVANRELAPETIYEKAWMRLVGRREIEPELAREYSVTDPGETWFRREAHWRYHR